MNPPESENSGTLYVVATPIGNLGDITLRAIDTLKQVATVVAEDTRRARGLLSHLGITGKTLLHVDAHASEATLDKVIQRLEQAQDVALLTDAGTPSVSDPGSALVRRCRERELKVVALPGPSAVTTAIAASGLVDSGFLFLGFIPRKGDKRRQVLERIQRTAEAVILFEAPGRTPALLTDLAELVPHRQICLARELTKKFEQVSVQVAAHWANSQTEELKGEVTLVIAPDPSATKSEGMSEEQLGGLLQELLAGGLSAKDAATHLAKISGLPKRDVYQLALSLKPKHQ